MKRKILFILFCICSFSSMVASKRTGAQDRELWVKYLCRIASPVIDNLAKGTLEANMPVETGKNFYGNPRDVTYLEAVGRTLAGIAPWLALPDDNTEEGKLRKSFRTSVLKGLKNGVSPESPDCLNFTRNYQPTVDAAYLAQAFLRAPKALWEPLDTLTKQRYVTAFKSLRRNKPVYNNHLLFAAIIETFLLKVGEQVDQAKVFHSDFSERMIMPDGVFPAFGRSATYRTGAFQSLSQVALMKILPSYIHPAQVRCALTAVFVNMYDGNQNFDKNGWLVLGFNGHQPELADYYTTTGSLYMATLGFLALGLPADDYFWTNSFEEWTSCKIWSGKPSRKDYKVEY